MKRVETYNNIGEYIKAYNRWLNAPAVIRENGTMEVKVKDAFYSKKEFDTNNPKPVYEPTPKRDLWGVPIERLK